jgi:hypothetical protein
MATDKDLKRLQFSKAGMWVPTSKYKGIRFVLCKYENDRVIYAFVCNGMVKYIGICQAGQTTLSMRMGYYSSQTSRNGENTNTRIRDKINWEFYRGNDIVIWALKPTAKKWRGIEIDLVMGLENSLLEQMTPEWNTQGI